MSNASTIVFTSAFISSEYSSGKQCFTSIANFTQITPYFTVTRFASRKDAQFQVEAASSFASFIGQPGCGVLIATPSRQVGNLAASTTGSNPFYTGTVTSLRRQTSRVSPAVATTTAPGNTSSQAPSATTGSSKAPLSVRAKIGIGLAAFGAVGITIVLAVVRYVIRRRRKLQERAEENITSIEGDQPYFQRKAELEARENIRFELHGDSRQNELSGESGICEIPSTKANPGEKPSHGQELRGEEHCKELE
ncbi:MAG: hypothetical protein Q9166_004678 [cf. Caloplaca sp. 2 TL-2023]